jgi:multicomponent Na+:H+ antiporter subunit B
MSLIVKTVTRLTAGLILLYGIYLMAHGHLTPGGGFVGGLVVALAYIHLTLSFGRKTAGPDGGRVEGWESLGALLFVLIALVGLLAGTFFLNWLPKGEAFRLASSGTIPLSNLAICLKVGAGVFAIFLILTLFRSDEEESS